MPFQSPIERSERGSKEPLEGRAVLATARSPATHFFSSFPIERSEGRSKDRSSKIEGFRSDLVRNAFTRTALFPIEGSASIRESLSRLFAQDFSATKVACDNQERVQSLQSLTSVRQVAHLRRAHVSLIFSHNVGDLYKSRT